MRTAGSLAISRNRPPLPGRLVAGLVIVGLLVTLALLSLIWTPASPTRMAISRKLLPPLEGGLLGTDHYGRDVASILMVGAQNSLLVAGVAVTLGAVVGIFLGLTVAARRGLLEAIVMRVCDVVFAFPPIVSAMMLGALMGPGRLTAILAIATFSVPVFARIAHGAALRIWARDYVLAARGAGKGAFGITRDHVLPNVAGLLAVHVTIQLGLGILAEAGLSFLGLGAPPPSPSWGRMLADAQERLGSAPWLAIAPGAAIAIAVLGLNLLGDGLRDLLDPRRAGGG